MLSGSLFAAIVGVAIGPKVFFAEGVLPSPWAQLYFTLSSIDFALVAGGMSLALGLGLLGLSGFRTMKQAALTRSAAAQDQAVSGVPVGPSSIAEEGHADSDEDPWAFVIRASRLLRAGMISEDDEADRLFVSAGKAISSFPT